MNISIGHVLVELIMHMVTEILFALAHHYLTINNLQTMFWFLKNDILKILDATQKEREALQKRGEKKIKEGIAAAKKATSNTSEDLATLEKLGKLRKAGVITEKEFQAKKKKILGRI